jgi:hypothetical protein
MDTVRRSSILTSIGFAAVSCLLAGRVAAQPLAATAGVVPDVCADSSQVGCTTATLHVVNGETLQIQTSMDLWRGLQNLSLRKLVAHPSGMFVYAARRDIVSPPDRPRRTWIDQIDLRTMTKVRQYEVFGDLKTISPDGTQL